MSAAFTDANIDSRVKQKTGARWDNALLSFLQQYKDLIIDNSPLKLRLTHWTQMLEGVPVQQCKAASQYAATLGTTSCMPPLTTSSLKE